MEAGKYLGDAVYGALDGIVTTFAIVAGVVGAGLSSNVILILGCANLFADGISMAAGNYLAKKSEEGFRAQQRNEEHKKIHEDPAQQRKDIEDIYRTKGFRGKLLERIVAHITRDEGKWIDEMMVGELGLFDSRVSPFKAGAATFVAFVVAGSVPLISYVLANGFVFFAQNAFVTASILTAMVLFVVGSLRALLIEKHWFKAGTEMLVVGGLASFAAYMVGFVLKNFV